MSRLHAIELHLLMLAGIAFLSISGWQVWRAGNVLNSAENSINSLNSLCATVRTTLEKTNTELDEAHRLTLEAGLTARDARKASDLELAYLPQWNAQINQTIAAMQRTANAASETLHGASLDLSALDASIQATKPLIEAGTATVKRYDALAPTLSATADNVKRMTSDGARITKDAADEADRLAHPPKKKLGFWGGVWVGAQYVHKMMPPIF